MVFQKRLWFMAKAASGGAAWRCRYPCHGAHQDRRHMVTASPTAACLASSSRVGSTPQPGIHAHLARNCGLKQLRQHALPPARFRLRSAFNNAAGCTNCYWWRSHQQLHGTHVARSPIVKQLTDAGRWLQRKGTCC